MFYYSSLKKILREEFNQIYIISFFVFLSALLELISLLMISYIIANAGQLNEVLNSLNNFIQIFNDNFLIENLASIFIFVLSYILLSVVFYLIIIRYSSIKVHGLVSNVRTRIIHKLLDMNYFVDGNQKKSKIISNIIFDSSQFGASLIDLVHLISRLCLTLIIFIWLLFVNVVVTLAMISILMILYLAIHFIITPKIRRSANNIAVFNELLIKELSNFFGYIREIIFYNIQDKVINQLSGTNNNIATSTGSKSFLVNMPRFLVDSLILILLASFVLVANSYQQDFVGFYSLLATYGIAAIKLLPAVQNIFYYTQQLLSRKPNMVNLNNFFDSKELHQKNTELIESLIPDLKEKIKLSNISYQSNTNDSILENISLEINFSDKLAIVGPSGSGKSFLMNTIIGLSSPTSGSLEIDGIRIDDSNVNSYRDKISYIPQKIFLSEGTIKDNVLLFSKENFKESKYKEALKQSGMESILNNSEQNDETTISDQSHNLSGGEKQCLGYARALYERRNIIALDEATSSMDFNLASKVISSILKEWKTVICITHQSYLLRNFEKIIVMDDGKIQDLGSYEDLLLRNKYFKNLCSNE